MDSNPKLEMHPDAESLNAFAEQALGEQERARIVTHLAECGRCREVVYLAQEGAEVLAPELAVAAAARQSDSFEKKEARFWNWRLAWVAAGALAVMVTATYVAHVRQVEIAAEQARAARDAAARNVEMASAPETAEMAMKAAPPPAGNTAVTQGSAAAASTGAIAAKKQKLEPPSIELQPMTVAAAPPPMEAAGAMGKSSSDQVALPSRSEAAYPTMNAAGQDKQGFTMGASQVRSQASEEQSQASAAKPAMHKAAGGMLATAARSTQVDANLDAKRGPTGNVESRGPQMGGGVLALGKARPAPLPSGLPAVSTASAQGSTLAVDEAGGVFVIKDAGGHWENVTKQWDGRAVAVRLQKPATGESASSTAMAIFEIVNDQGQVWVSTDGRNWKAK